MSNVYFPVHFQDNRTRMQLSALKVKVVYWMKSNRSSILSSGHCDNCCCGEYEIMWGKTFWLISQFLKTWALSTSQTKCQQSERQRGKMGEKKSEEYIRWGILKLPSAYSAYYVSHLINWWGLFWRWLFVSCCDWNNNDGVFVFLLHLPKEKKHRELFLHCRWHNTWSRAQPHKQSRVCSAAPSWLF